MHGESSPDGRIITVLFRLVNYCNAANIDIVLFGQKLTFTSLSSKVVGQQEGGSSLFSGRKQAFWFEKGVFVVLLFLQKKNNTRQRK